jgi:hypothetical protein
MEIEEDYEEREIIQKGFISGDQGYGCLSLECGNGLKMK